MVFSEDGLNDLSNILDRTCSNYDKDVKLGSIEDYLLRAYNDEENICLICISTIHRKEEVWNCQFCYVLFHLSCIKAWAKDCLFRYSVSSDENIDKNWTCPNCRHVFTQQQVPVHYTCYCHQTCQPPFDPWLLPHSCGLLCSRALSPACGHTCKLLCHPGPCPPCPQTVSEAPCFCGQCSLPSVRCYLSKWSCDRVCGKQLSCAKHACQRVCHSGECGECTRTDTYSCVCGKHTSTDIPCSAPVWCCDSVCGKLLNCGVHTCQAVCHEAGACEPCQYTAPQSCGCGKTMGGACSPGDSLCRRLVQAAQCDDTAGPVVSLLGGSFTCDGTCERLLACQLHTCPSRCHLGDCEPCVQMRMKKCRCGRKERMMECGKTFICEHKCKRLKSCGRHHCGKKCCDTSDCRRDCDLPCGRALNCRRHECEARCHSGPCYPCQRRVQLTCHCTRTTHTVQCSRWSRHTHARMQSGVTCTHPCANPPPACGHVPASTHPCHFGPCPPCVRVCGKPLSCGRHHCQRLCHHGDDCAACEVTLSIPCAGGHTHVQMLCSEYSESQSPPCCEAICGRQLPCGNHTCRRKCHVLKTKRKSNTCEQCTAKCERQRPSGCQHQCPAVTCHPDTCPPCRVHRRVRCHCAMLLLHVVCEQLSAVCTAEDAHLLLSCGNVCPKLLDCGHRCDRTCHSGECQEPTVQPPDECSDRQRLGCAVITRVRCACRSRVLSVTCSDLQSRRYRQSVTIVERAPGMFILECSSQCRSTKSKNNLSQTRAHNNVSESDVLVSKSNVSSVNSNSTLHMMLNSYAFRYGRGVLLAIFHNSLFRLIGTCFFFILFLFYLSSLNST